MSVTMRELFELEGRTVAVCRGVQATLRRVGPAVEVCFEGAGGTTALVLVEDGGRFGEVGCPQGWSDGRLFCPGDLDELDVDVVEVRTLDGLRRSRSLATPDAARLSA